MKASNVFRLGKLTRNTRNGTGLLVVDLPGTGTLSLTGRGLAKRQQSVSTAGSVELAIKTKGSFVERLARTGQLKLTASITFTPTGGDPSTRTRLVKLIEE
jgi:hypothetical protein